MIFSGTNNVKQFPSIARLRSVPTRDMVTVSQFVDTIQCKSYYRKSGRPHNTLFHAKKICPSVSVGGRCPSSARSHSAETLLTSAISPVVRGVLTGTYRIIYRVT